VHTSQYKSAPYDVARLGAVRQLVEEAMKRLEEAQRLGLAPDDGGMLLETREKLLALGIVEPSFDRSRLGNKVPGDTVPCLKILALCPMKGEHQRKKPMMIGGGAHLPSCLLAEEDLEGDSKSGQALRAALHAIGLGFGRAPSTNAPYPLTVLWRNLRGLCWRKDDVRV
jgi:hypothetical protein